MDSQTVSSIATAALTLVPAIVAWLANLTMYGRAQQHIDRADMMSHLGITDEAEISERRARELVVRPAVMSELAVFGPFAPSDLLAGVLIGISAALVIDPSSSIMSLTAAFFVCVTAGAVILRDGKAIDQLCKERAAKYEADRAPKETSTGSDAGSSAR